MRRSRSAAAGRLGMILGFAVVAAGCSQASVPPSTTAAPTSTLTTLAPTTSTTSASSTTTTTTQPKPPPLCVASQLKVFAAKGTGAAGSIFSPVEVANTSTSPCYLDGRPSVRLIGAMQGAQPAPLSTTIGTTGQGSVFSTAPAKLTLPAGSAASVGFMLQSSDVPSDGEQTCPVVSSMSVTLPGIASPFSVEATFTACGGPTIYVSAIVPASALQSD